MTPGVTALIVGLQPIVTGIFAQIFFKEVVIIRQWIGLLLGFLGAALVVGEKHLKLSIKQKQSKSIDGIAFGMAEFYDEIKKGLPFDICYSIEENEWKGRVSLQLKIRDIKLTFLSVIVTAHPRRMRDAPLVVPAI